MLKRSGWKMTEAEIKSMFARCQPSETNKIKLARGCQIATMKRFFPERDMAAMKKEAMSEDGRKRKKKGGNGYKKML